MDGLATPFDGILLVHKPSGPTSYDVIRLFKRRFRGVKIGHSGTLDPLASGLLILLLGKATKKQSEIMGRDKTYLARCRLGIKTDSGDISGKIIEQKSVPPLNETVVKDVLKSFIGEIEQIPPMYSALKLDGAPLYKLARKGVVVERKPRRIHIHSLSLLKTPLPEELEIEVHCSSGTYVRTLVEDIGDRLGTVATLAGLVRVRIGEFDLSQAINAEEIQNEEAERLLARLQPAA